MRRITRAANPIGKAMAGHRWFKLYGLLVHTGRTSGQEYRIAVVVRPFEGGFVIPMPFGPATQWAKNVIAAGGATVLWNGRTYRVIDPQLIDSATAGATMAGWQRAAGDRVGIDTYMQVRIADPA
jgi:deazaflavin-dependent oxidoreductase (nitroreductase family)